MNSNWRAFLEARGANFDQEGLSGFTSETVNDWSEAHSSIALLPKWGVIRVTGKDAADFLQAHFTNDVSALNDAGVQFSGYCSPKGRLLAVFYLIKVADEFQIVMPADLIPSVVKRLELFAKMARPVGKNMIGKAVTTDVTLTDESESLQVLGICGKDASEDLLAGLGLAADALLNSDIAGTRDDTGQGCRTVVKLPEARERFLCVGNFSSLSRLWSYLEQHPEQHPEQRYTPVSADHWLLEDIRSGMPSVVAETQEKFVPQMVNMHVINGVSFTKGCYPGQEIVARMQYLGKIKRQMLRFRYTGEPVSAGTSVIADGDADAGIVVASAVCDSGKCEALVVLKTSVFDTGETGSTTVSSTAQLSLSDGAVLEQLDMPYALQLKES